MSCTSRKRTGWTVNLSAYAYAGSNPAPATTAPATTCHRGPRLYSLAATTRSFPIVRRSSAAESKAVATGGKLLILRGSVSPRARRGDDQQRGHPGDRGGPGAVPLALAPGGGRRPDLAVTGRNSGCGWLAHPRIVGVRWTDMMALRSLRGPHFKASSSCSRRFMCPASTTPSYLQRARSCLGAVRDGPVGGRCCSAHAAEQSDLIRI